MFLLANIREFLLAVQFFTRIPVTGRLAQWVGYSPDMLRRSAAYFPAVGWLVGSVAAAVYALLLYLLPSTPSTPLVAAVLSTVATVLLTGGFHEDGLADMADGLGGHVTRERALKIMKDSRIGAYGAMALVLALLSKIALLALLGSSTPHATPFWHFPGSTVCAALLAAHTVSRGLPLLLIAGLPYVGDSVDDSVGDGAGPKSKPLADSLSARSLALGWLFCLGALALCSLLIAPLSLLIASALALTAWLWMARGLQRRLQGFTGDCLGATQQVCEIAFYLGLCISL